MGVGAGAGAGVGVGAGAGAGVGAGVGVVRGARACASAWACACERWRTEVVNLERLVWWARAARRGVGPSAESGADDTYVGARERRRRERPETPPPLFDFASVLAQFKGLRFAPPARRRAAPAAPLSRAPRAAVTAAPLSAERQTTMLRL